MSADLSLLLEFLRHQAGRPMDAREIARGLGLPVAEVASLRERLRELESSGLVYRVQRDRFAAPERINLVVARLRVRHSGWGVAAPEIGGPEVQVPPEGLGSAQDGDRVVVRLERRRPADRPQGRVVKVLARVRGTVVGSFHERHTSRGRYGVVVPVDQRLRSEVMVPAGSTGDAADGQLVVVRITDWGSGLRGPVGDVERVLGRLGEPGVDVEVVIAAHELPLEFAPEAEMEAAALAARGITADDVAGREDLRELLVFTIDPADAKDHDDALSIRRLGADRWEVGVHIADVSHYVRAESPLDREALRRGTSTYLVDRVLPMLPHPLSSDLCSLKPGEDRLTQSLLLVLDGKAQVQEQRLCRAVIRSRHKLAYEEAQAVLDGSDLPDVDTAAALRWLLPLSRSLRAAREARGSLDFDLPEARVLLSATGEPLDITRRERLEAHRIVEDFMLLANETIARQGAASGEPFLYRIHETPEEERLEQLRQFAATLGLGLGAGTPHDLQRLLRQVDGKPEDVPLSTLLLRSMKQARYSAENRGHYGLAAPHYTHFTSPIRRYPDLVVHRLVALRLIDGEQGGLPADALEAVAIQSSERERNSEAAERDSVELKKVEFMQRHIGDVFEGSIAGVTSFGFFVLLDRYHVEGLVHVSGLGDDYYRFVEEQLTLVGEHTGRRFRLGDRVRVRVAAAELEQRRIDFVLEETAGTISRSQHTRGRPGGKPSTGHGPRRGSGKRPPRGGGGGGRRSR